MFDSIDPVNGKNANTPHRVRLEAMCLPSGADYTERRLVVFEGQALGCVERRYSRTNSTQLTAFRWQGSSQLGQTLDEIGAAHNSALHETDDVSSFIEAWMGNGDLLLAHLLREANHCQLESGPIAAVNSNSPIAHDCAKLQTKVLGLVLGSTDLANLLIAFTGLEPEERTPFVEAIVSAPDASIELWRITPQNRRGALPLMLSVSQSIQLQPSHRRSKRLDELMRRLRHLPLPLSARICVLAGWPRPGFRDELINESLPLIRHWWRANQQQGHDALERLMRSLELRRRARCVRLTAAPGTVIDADEADYLLGITDCRPTAASDFDNMLQTVNAHSTKTQDGPGVSADRLAQVLQDRSRAVTCDLRPVSGDSYADVGPPPNTEIASELARTRAYRALRTRKGAAHPDTLTVRNGSTINWPCLIAKHHALWEEVIADHTLILEQGLAVLPLNSLDALAAEGLAMHHCLLDYWADAESGSFRAFSVRRFGERIATLGIWRSAEGRGMWSLHEFVGKRNAAVLDDGRTLSALIGIVTGFYNYFGAGVVE